LKKIIIACVLCAGLALVFVYGMLVQRNRIFPYYLIRSMALSTGVVEGIDPVEVRPRSKALAQLSALPYVDASLAAMPDERGVVVNDSSKASPGYNFYNSWKRPQAWLMDMQGNVLHEWHNPDFSNLWHHAELLPNGDILVSVKDTAIIKLDKSSNLLWSYKTRAHHIFWIEENGDIWLVSREAAIDPEIHPTAKTLDDKILVLTSDGEKKAEFSVLDIIRRSPYAYLLPSVAHDEFPTDTELDIFHTNYVEVFDGTVEGPLAARGNLLISMKHLNAVAILNGETLKIEWLWGPGNLTLQHYPTLLENGNVLLFDNGPKISRVLEIEPQTMKVVWSYERGEGFFSGFGGANQRLENGNTIITETEKGRSFEVTEEGEIVWEFLNPEVGPQGHRTNVWCLKRFGRAELESFWE
jgi:hypothetical protein